ncbi:MAG: xanthine dehydrogenase family protein molybdopterin-binding subunit [Nitrososphaerota archaeon]|nr:xanthine dehydrogenase family protein molybdopterin-binding subunit [Nitrososphaerota archaeon]MDG6966702.1 xanthine dehydrogenase family protein molybdopterin-binding subunit [Nitrososphaerota archaeon]MDG6979281.1 xanthine dehydrogenase family protein molybdopterin-binding subunit [Nitrososphaerota archaeon]
MAKRASSARLVSRPAPMVGQPLKRVEDRKFITGTASYLGDLKLEGMLHAAFVRSPHAHAKVLGVETERALAQPGVVAVLTAADLEGRVAPLMEPPAPGEAEGWGANRSGVTRMALATGVVNYPGEAVAVVLAEDKYSAEDGAELVGVDYESLPAVTDPERALEPGAPVVHADLATNLASHETVGAGDVSRAFKRADRVVKVRLLNQRLAPSPMEPRGVVAHYDRGTGLLTVHLSTQDPHGARGEIADKLMLREEDVRVIAPDVGGAFGGKAGVYPEDVVVAHAARLVNRPVKWVETRRENLLTMTQGRGQVQYAELAMSREGRILGYKVRLVVDGGAYGGERELARITLDMAPGVYDIPSFQGEADVAITNKVPMGAYRGAGRPEAAYLIERAINVASARMKLDPVKVRRLNYIKKDKFPFKTSGGMTYDSGDYHANLQKALKVSGYEGLLAERARARQEGRLVGIGLATWVEVCSFGPSWPQSASMTVTEEGRVLLNLGGHSHGQGHATTFTQVVADELGVAVGDVTVQDGDTAMLPWSSLTAGSRSAALSGGAAVLCARKIREKMAAIAARKLGARSPAKMVFSKGHVFREDLPSKRLRFADVARMAYAMWSLPPGMEMTLFAYGVYAPKSNAYPFGTHVALVEVDRESGLAKVLKYFAVDDGGKMINPMIVEGQVQGGVAQGIGQAITEELAYDQEGQPLSTTFADYLIPSADVMPHVVWDTTNTPTDANLLGVKGMGEAGTIAATPTVVNAIEDALSEFGALVERMPASPAYLRSLMKR